MNRIVLPVIAIFISLFIQQSQGAISVAESGVTNTAQDVIQVYRVPFDGEAPLDPWDIQKELEEKDVVVLSSYVGYDGLMYSLADRSDADSPTINIVSVPVEFYEQVKELGFRLCKELQEEGGDCHAVSYTELMTGKQSFTISVYKPAGEKQCYPGSGVDIATMEQELVEAEIMVYQRYQASDGMRHDFSCETNTPDINVYVIEASRLAEVMSIEYRECAWLEMNGGGCHPLPSEN